MTRDPGPRGRRRGPAVSRHTPLARARSTRPAPPRAATIPAPARVDGLDALRGTAILAMIAYHLCFDLRYFGMLHADFEHDPRWLLARTLILSSFLLIAGISAVLASRVHAAPGASWRRVARVGVAALAVSAASYLMFPQSFIWFGVLHAIALSLLLTRPLVARPALALLAGLIVIAAGATFDAPAFDNRALGWIGFMTRKPMTEDYVPLVPWTGVMLLGIALGHALVRSHFRALAPLSRAPFGLRAAGRHSLAVYLAHQPLMIAAIALLARVH